MNISERLTYDFYSGPEEGKFSLALTMETNGGEDIEVVRLYLNESFDFCMNILENRNNMQVDELEDDGLTRETREQGDKELEAKVISVETINLFSMGPCISFNSKGLLNNEQTERFLTFYKNEKHELHIWRNYLLPL